MSFFHVHPDDARWLKRWLRGNLICVLICGCLLLLLRLETYIPQASTRARAEAARVDLGRGDLGGRDLGGRDLGSGDAAGGRAGSTHFAVIPSGWRRTAAGWEHVSTWRTVTRPLGEIIVRQQLREPAWIRLSLQNLRSVPPLAFATLQLAAITAILQAGKLTRKPT